MVEPEYAQNIVVGVTFRNTFVWYVTEYAYWYLDYLKYDHALTAIGYKERQNVTYQDRFGIAILNEDTAEHFLSLIADLRVSVHVLTQMMLTRRETELDDDLLDFVPCLYIDFDHKLFLSQYPEMIRFELYIPDGWIGAYNDFTEKIPLAERYWLFNGENLFIKQ